MEGIDKLKLGIGILLILMVLSIISSFILVSIDDQEFVDEYNQLSYEDQQAISDFYDRLPDRTYIYTIFGWFLYIVAGGLFLILWKIWHLRGI